MSASPTAPQLDHPPPPPPLPPSRLSQLQRFIAPLSGLAKPARSATDHLSDRPLPPTRPVARPSHGSEVARSTVQHRTGIPIAAIDINRGKTHAVLAGKDILKTVRVADGKASEDINLRASILSFHSRYASTDGDSAKRRRDYLPARDVKWSTGSLFPNIIATAAANGRIALYDVDAAGSRLELAWMHEHTAQVNKIDIDPFAGRLLLSASQDQTVKLWDIRDPRAGKAKSRFDVRNGVRHVCWSPKDGNDFDFAVCADGGLVQNWDIRSHLAPKVSIHAHDKGCYSLDWHPDGRHVVTGGFDKYVKTWDFKSNNRRQKPAFQFRVSQAVRSVNWRPASELYYKGTWQTTHIATTYHHDDPRVHVWDLTRPHLPWLELCTTNRPPTDLLWASADHVWTAGEEGVFTQFDINALPKVSESVSPSTLLWVPGGESAMFMEERAPIPVRFQSEMFSGPSKENPRGQSEKERTPQEDEEESFSRMSFASSMRSRQNRELSFRSDTSRTNSPPEKRPVQQLDKTVHAGRILHQNTQIGAIGRVPSASENKDVASFLANNYAPIATEDERRASPDLILSRLRDAFMNNAEVSDDAALYRQAQSWRMLAAVIVPELEAWAKSNQESRKLEIARRQSLQKAGRPTTTENSPAFTKVIAADRNTKVDPKENKIISNLFKGLKEPGRTEHDSSSNVTTPLARPVNDSPRHTPRQHRSKGSSSSLNLVDDLPVLPPSLLNSHATAAAASKALHNSNRLDSVDDSFSPMSSPEQPRAKQVKSPDLNSGLLSPRQTLKPGEAVPRASPYLQAQKQEQKRNALRDYRVQARPIFSLDTKAPDPDYSKNSQHDSAESFPMFSASTGSSQKAHLMGQSTESKVEPDSVQRQSSWLSREDSSESPSVAGKSSGPAAQRMLRDFSMGSDAPQFNMDETPELKADEFEVPNASQEHSASLPYSEVAAISVSPDMSHFVRSQSPRKPKIHVVNPALQPVAASAKAVSSSVRDLSDEELKQDGLIFEDFRPIDMASYRPSTPFAWSAFPLLCHMIAYDVDSGVACGQLATHLILHMAPYFFGPSSANAITPYPKSLAERLMLPKYAQRCIEAILRKHLTFLKQIKQTVAYAALRSTCVDLGYDKNLFSSEPKPAERSVDKDSSIVPVACSNCGTEITAGRRVCDACRNTQAPCPLCSRSKPPETSLDAATTTPTSTHRSTWLTCQSCGHTAHHSCMTQWLLRPSTHGICPTPGCTCDCGPGIIRDKRIDRQHRAFEEQQLIHGSSTVASAKRDSLKASQSPAVDRARAVMRAASRDSGREVQSGDEKVSAGGAGRRSSARVSGGGTGSGSTTSAFGMSSRKSVRLMAPGEEEALRLGHATNSG
ncbi:putative WD repeat-containing protein [Cyphellophora attinorum]|uniref:Restriction of telomere capping protein 1 n=1 Tax=Cyphellophora attinorum TaxID=1664694 RepID=A0A0N0NJX4_9EURO|nr:putative WD repeat-containing protein [Phialophora attinorum]KPI37149.1 putative WD repeat-containing protein [Phialophora attinorum]